jgi:integrase/recombinase XerD
MQNITTAIKLDIRTQKKDGSYPVKLYVAYNRTQKYYPLHVSLTEEDFEKTQGPKPRATYKELKLKFQAVEQRARKIIEELPVFTFDKFEKRLKGNYSKNDVFSSYRQYIEQLSKEGRAGTASNYQCSMNSIKEYWKKDLLPFEAVTPDFLRHYENWMRTNGKSLTTVGIYLRPLRALFNTAIQNGEAHADLFPFDKRRYQIPTGRNTKKALPIADIEKIFNYEASHSGEARARDLWLFSYLTNGMNIKDIARLKYSNIHGDRIEFIRAKTERATRKNLKKVIAILQPEAKEIIERWGNKPAYSSSFVFPLLIENLSAEQELSMVRSATKTINKYIKRIAKQVGIETNVSTYTARHSFATILKNAGVSTEFIAESLGHNDLKTTENYLDSFVDETKRKHTTHLTSFNNKS